jgi:hypothetical protein
MSTHPLTDNYGREITVTLNEDGSTIAESTSLTIDWPGTRSDPQILDTFNSHQPEGWIPPLADQAVSKSATVDAMIDQKFNTGYSPPSGALFGQTLQVRDQTDRTNWLTSQAAYFAAVANGAGSVEGAVFRTTSNQNFTLTYAEGLSVLLSMDGSVSV